MQRLTIREGVFDEVNFAPPEHWVVGGSHTEGTEGTEGLVTAPGDLGRIDAGVDLVAC